MLPLVQASLACVVQGGSCVIGEAELLYWGSTAHAACSHVTVLEPVDCLRANKRTQLTALRPHFPAPSSSSVLLSSLESSDTEVYGP